MHASVAVLRRPLALCRTIMVSWCLFSRNNDSVYILRYRDILYELASVGDLPLPQSSPPATNKRERDSETPISGTPPSSSASPPERPRNIAGSRRVNKESSFGNISKRPSFNSMITMNYGQQPGPPLSSASHQSLKLLPRRTTDTQPQQLLSDQSSTSPSSSIPQTPQSANSNSASGPIECFSLPVYSNELGRIPLHSQVTFTAQAQIPPQNQAQLPQHLHPNNLWFQNASTSGSESLPSSSQLPLTSSLASSSSIFNTHVRIPLFPEVQILKSDLLFFADKSYRKRIPFNWRDELND